GRYPHELPLPDGCPVHARAASTDPDATVSLGPATELPADPSTKELVLSRRGMRLVWQVGEADAGRYRVGRRIDLGAPLLSAADVTARCDTLAASVRDHLAVVS